MLPPDVVEWLRGNQDPRYAEYVLREREAVEQVLGRLAIDPSGDLACLYRDFGPATVAGWYELNDADALEDWTAYARDELGVGEEFVALTSIEGQGITLYHRGTGQVFDVEYGQFDALAAGELPPVAGSFAEFLRWCRARSEEDA